MKHNGQNSAFPQSWHSTDAGLTKRELFAMEAMKSMLSAVDDSFDAVNIAKAACGCADQLLAKLASTE